MQEVRFLQIPLLRRVAACRLKAHQPVTLLRRHAQIDHQILDRKAVNAIFELPQPRRELSTPFGRHARRLVGKVGSDVAVHDDYSARIERVLQFGLCLKAVARVEECREMGIYVREWPEFTV